MSSFVWMDSVGLCEVSQIHQFLRAARAAEYLGDKGRSKRWERHSDTEMKGAQNPILHILWFCTGPLSSPRPLILLPQPRLLKLRNPDSLKGCRLHICPGRAGTWMGACSNIILIHAHNRREFPPSAPPGIPTQFHLFSSENKRKRKGVVIYP